MSNFKKANKLASEWIDSMGGLDNIHYIFGDDVSGLMQAFRDEGLLAPDLPEPDVIRPGSRMKFWFDENIYAYEGSGRVRVIADDVRFTVDEAREHALSVLAACEYAEKEQDNG